MVSAELSSFAARHKPDCGGHRIVVTKLLGNSQPAARGARRRDVLRLVGFSAGTSVGLRIVAGLALSVGMNSLIARCIESGTRDPFLILAVSLVLVAVAALACMVPARRALAIDPMTALRCE